MDEERVRTLNSDLADYGVSIQHLTLMCSECGRRWGASLNEKMDDILLQKCTCLECKHKTSK